VGWQGRERCALLRACHGWADELFGYRLGDPEADVSCDDRDSAAYAPLAVIIDPAFTWGG